MQIQYIEPAPGEYRPGVCNIGPREIARRRAFGVAGVVSAVVLGALLLAVDASPLVRAIVVFPLWGAIISFEQARRRFCAGFAFAGIRSVAGSDATESVADRSDLVADRATARRMVAYCGAIAIALTALFVLVPV
jgi:hypothetical protein